DQMRTQLLGRFIDGKPGWIRCDLEKYSAGLTKINRMKILPIDDRRDVVLESCQCPLPFFLLRIRRRPPRDVMDGTHGDAPRPARGRTNDIDKRTGATGGSGIAKPVAASGGGREAHSFRQK